MSDACLKIDECDSRKACDGSLQLLSNPGAAASNDTKLRAESRSSQLFFNITPKLNLPITELDVLEHLSHEAFLRAQCAEGYEGRLCHTCSDGWARSGKADCSSCDRPIWADYLCVGAITLLFCAVYTFVVRGIVPTLLWVGGVATTSRLYP